MSEHTTKKIAAMLRNRGVETEELISGTVVAGSVDEDAMTCSVQVLGMDEAIEGVLLNVIESNVKGCVAVPADGSHVWIGSIDGPGEWGIFKTEQVKKVLVDVDELVQVKVKELKLECDNSTLAGKKDEWSFNDGKNGGVPVAKKIADRLNNIEDDLNGLKDVFISWTISPQDGGAALRVAATGTPSGPALPINWAGQRLGKSKGSDMENQKVKH